MSRIAPLKPPYAPEIHKQFDLIMRGAPPLTLFRVMAEFLLTNSLWSLTFGYLSITLPFCMWLLWAFCRSIPVELEEAAMMDGAGRLRVFVDIVLPSALPGIIAAAIFSLIVSWNDYLFARVFINSIENLPLTVGVMHFFEGVHVDWGLIMASAVLMPAPLAGRFLLPQTHPLPGVGPGPAQRLARAGAPRARRSASASRGCSATSAASSSKALTRGRSTTRSATR